MDEKEKLVRPYNICPMGDRGASRVRQCSNTAPLATKLFAVVHFANSLRLPTQPFSGNEKAKVKYAAFGRSSMDVEQPAVDQQNSNSPGGRESFFYVTSPASNAFSIKSSKYF